MTTLEQRIRARIKAPSPWPKVAAPVLPDEVQADAPAARSGLVAERAEVLELVEAGLGASAIARKVGVGRATVYRWLAEAGVTSKTKP